MTTERRIIVEAARTIPATPGSDGASAPFLPPSAARPAPRFEPRVVEIDLAFAHRHRRTSMRAYVLGAVGLAAVSVGGWFALEAYIYR